MTPEQKQQAQQAIEGWQSVRNDDPMKPAGDVLAALLQELVDAPEEFESLTRNEDGTVSLKPGFKAVAYTAHEALPATNPAQISSLEPAPSVPDGWRSAIAKEFPLYDEDEIDEDKHCCEWVMLQERKRLHKILAAPTPAPSVTGEELQAAFDRGLKAGNEQKDAQQVEIHRLHDLLAATPTPPEPPADLPTWENGDDPLVGGGLISRGVVDFATVGIWPTKPAPSVPDTLTAQYVTLPDGTALVPQTISERDAAFIDKFARVTRIALGEGFTPLSTIQYFWHSLVAHFQKDGRLLAAAPTPAPSVPAGGLSLAGASPDQSEQHLEMVPADAARDAERLDWLDVQCSENNGRHILCPPGGLRAAIDAARREKGGA